MVSMLLVYHSRWSSPLLTSTNTRSESTWGSGGMRCIVPLHKRYPKSSPASTQNCATACALSPYISCTFRASGWRSRDIGVAVVCLRPTALETQYFNLVCVINPIWQTQGKSIYVRGHGIPPRHLRVMHLCVNVHVSIQTFVPDTSMYLDVRII